MKNTTSHLYNAKRKTNYTVDKYIRNTVLRTKTNIQSNPTTKNRDTSDICEQPLKPPCPLPNTNTISDFTEIATNTKISTVEEAVNMLTTRQIEEFFENSEPTQAQVCIGYALYKLLNRAFHTNIYDGEMVWDTIAKYARINAAEILTLLQMIPSTAELSSNSQEIIKLRKKYLIGCDIVELIHGSTNIGEIGKVVVGLISLFEVNKEKRTITQIKARKQTNKSFDMGRQLMSYR